MARLGAAETSGGVEIEGIEVGGLGASLAVGATTGAIGGLGSAGS